jgi:hypothetical protein
MGLAVAMRDGGVAPRSEAQGPDLAVARGQLGDPASTAPRCLLPSGSP